MKRPVTPTNDAYSPGVQNLSDVPARLAAMDRLGIDVQVIFPSFLLNTNIKRAEIELALCRAYNRWMAETTAASHSRLRWIAVVPLLDMVRACAELETARKGGACGVLFRGTERDRILADPYFFPLYVKAEELDMPICIHVGNSFTALNEIVDEETVILDVFPVPAAMFSLLVNKIPDRFPNLRFGFLESSAQWLPFILQESTRGMGIGGRERNSFEGVLEKNRFFVACQTDDDLPYLLPYAGENNLIFGSDYGHSDVGTDLEGHRILLAREDLPAGVAEKITDANARRLFGL